MKLSDEDIEIINIIKDKKVVVVINKLDLPKGIEIEYVKR